MNEFFSQEFIVSKNSIIETSEDSCDILKYEFLLHKPCQKLTDLLEDSLERLRLQSIVRTPESANSQSQPISKQSGYDIDCSESDEEVVRIDPKVVADVTLPEEGHERRLVLMTAVAPFFHTYLAVAKTLHLLIENNMVEGEFVMACVKEITNRVEDFECKYGGLSFAARFFILLIAFSLLTRRKHFYRYNQKLYENDGEAPNH